MEKRERLTTQETDDVIGVAFENLEFKATFRDVTHDILIHRIQGAEVTATIDGIRRRAQYAINHTTLYLDASGQTLEIENRTYQPALSDDAAGSGRILANTEGLVIAVAAEVGTRVSKGDLLVTIEAMKMEHRLLADGDGTVKEVNVQTGTQAKKGQVMAVLELDESEEDQ
jgi:geranyl-CoA carboxylase alpha subunit